MYFMKLNIRITIKIICYKLQVAGLANATCNPQPETLCNI